MGAWGTGIFDNDTAADWGHALAERDDLAFVEETLAKVLSAGSAYLESDDACEGLAACEVVARLCGQFGVRDSYTGPIDNWIAKHQFAPSPVLVGNAIASVDRALREPSELLELWSESEDFDSFKQVVSNLRERLSSCGHSAPMKKPWWKFW